MTRVIDLNAQRKASGREPCDVLIGERTYHFSARLPVSIGLQAARLASGDMDAEAQEAVFMTICRAMVGGDDAPELVASVDVDELMWLMKEVYEVELGESSASAASSSTTRKRSRRT